ncbi:glycoside hydrolase family 15 protein [Streptomyces sp. NPDC059604]|uniref:glycoside hydrolase family 15 protein n=1 Tax=Streptomyces sp. NPDC059604 TaxID=3346881 RepID=UPI0036B4F653
MHYPRIEDYAFIGDMRTSALVGRNGSLDWLCLPRFDTAAVFTKLLGTEEHGFWRIGPAGKDHAPYADRRRYWAGSLALESEWDTPRGTLRVTDFMPPHGQAPQQVIRMVTAVAGEVEIEAVLRPRFGYGKHAPWIYESGGRMVAVCGPDTLLLDIPAAAKTEEKDGALHSRCTVTAGQTLVFALSWQPSDHTGAPTSLDALAALARTDEVWREWVTQCAYRGPYREAVVRSLITLKALTYAPTGGIVAAPTTSLPEEIGGVRNWDYRYVWLRDAAITLSALLRVGYRREAEAWRRWLLRAVAGDPENLQIMYGIGGERELGERELCWLPGYENSAPVRVGNGAADQLQLDVPGAVIEMLFMAHEHGVARCDDSAALIEKLISYVRRHWQEPDDGIWEVRGRRRHFVHSKVMLWVAVDRAVRLAEAGVLGMDLTELMSLRAEIHADVCERGFDRERNTFTQSYGSQELDAALLLIPTTGFLPSDDPRVVGTVDAVMRELATPDGLVHRYRTAGVAEGGDGLSGDEGAFLLCSFWLVDALALTNRLPQAQALFERLLGLRSDLGLLAEEYDPAGGRQLGNFPQAYSHLAVVQSAVLLNEIGREASAA